MKQLLLYMKTAPIGLGAYFAVGILVLNYLVHMRSHWVFIMEFVLLLCGIFLASMHLREGQMG
jgi:uncharacterized membrane protein